MTQGALDKAYPTVFGAPLNADEWLAECDVVS